MDVKKFIGVPRCRHYQIDQCDDDKSSCCHQPKHVQVAPSNVSIFTRDSIVDVQWCKKK